MNQANENNNPEQRQPELGLFDLLGSALKDLGDLLRNLKFAAVILGIIAITSLLGIVLPQTSAPPGTPDQEMITAYGENLYTKLIRPLGLDRVYSTTWYRFLMLLLVASVTLCAWTRTKTAIALTKAAKPFTSEKGVKSLKFHGEMDFKKADEAKTWIAGQFQKHGFKIYEEEKDGAIHIFGRKNLAGKWMLVAMHYSFMFILVGAIIGGLFGSQEYVTINENDEYKLPNGKGSIRLIDYWMEYNAKDFPDEFSYFVKTPSDYKSKIETLDDRGNVLDEKIVEVNSPLNFEGYKFYQTAWEFQPIFAVYKNGKLVIRSPVESGQDFAIGEGSIDLSIADPQSIPFPIISGIKITENTDGTFTSTIVPPTCIMCRFVKNDKGEVNVELLEEAGNGTGIFKKGEKVDFDINGSKYELAFEGMKEYTVLEVKRDPGVGFVFLGFLICVIGATGGLLAPYGISRALIEKTSGGYRVLWGSGTSAFAGQSEQKNR